MSIDTNAGVQNAFSQQQQSAAQRLNLQNGDNYLNAIANRFIVKPRTAKGIAGFIFDYEGEDTVTYQSEITDHYVETNDAVQDHVALRPVKIVLRGFVSELVQTPPAGIIGALATIQSKLTAVPAYLGKYTPGAINAFSRAVTTAQNVATQINTGLSKIQNIIGFLPGAAPQKSRQQRAFAQLVALWESRQVMTVETPYRYYDSMMIESVAFTQPEETQSWSDISVSLKQIRFVEIQTVALNGTFEQRAALQRQGVANQGKTQGTEKPVSLLRKAFAGAL